MLPLEVVSVRGSQEIAANVRSVSRAKHTKTPPRDDAMVNSSGGSEGKATAGRTSQCRHDALTGRWVIFAPGRSERPAEIFETELPVPSGAHCPFCAGNESHTPPATFSIHDPLQDAEINSAVAHEPWSVRVVPNLFPAVSAKLTSSPDADLQTEDSIGSSLGMAEDAADFAPEGLSSLEDEDICKLLQDSVELQEIAAVPRSDEFDQAFPFDEDTIASDGSPNPLFEVSSLHGGHEVIVETPNHVESLTALGPDHAGRVFEAYAERMRHWFDVPGVQYVVAFKNVGAAAGASLRHTHSQLIATSLLPPAMTEIGRRVKGHHRHTQNCLLCEMIEGEVADGRRIVMQTDRFVAYCPFASRLPYLVRVAPLQHADRFELESTEALHELSLLTQKVLRAMESMFVACAYNYTLHTRPRRVASSLSFHWWMEIFPRLTKVAGFEWGSDCYINPVVPEVAASHLRGERTARHASGGKSGSVEFSD